MANIISSSEIAGLYSIVVDAIPNSFSGTPAPVGSMARFNGDGSMWLKIGSSDTNWSLVTTGSQSVSAYAGSDILIPGSTLTPVTFGTISWIDTSIFGLSVGSSDIEVKQDSMLNASGQFSVLFTTGGTSSSRTKARGYMYRDSINGGTGPWTAIEGTRGWGYHRQLSEGDDTITLSREFHVTAGTFLRYAVQRVSGTGALKLDGDGCNIVLRRTGQ